MRTVARWFLLIPLIPLAMPTMSFAGSGSTSLSISARTPTYTIAVFNAFNSPGP